MSNNINIIEAIFQENTLSPLLFLLFLSDLEEYFRKQESNGFKYCCFRYPNISS